MNVLDHIVRRQQGNTIMVWWIIQVKQHDQHAHVPRKRDRCHQRLQRWPTRLGSPWAVRHWDEALHELPALRDLKGYRRRVGYGIYMYECLIALIIHLIQRTETLHRNLSVWSLSGDMTAHTCWRTSCPAERLFRRRPRSHAR